MKINVFNLFGGSLGAALAGLPMAAMAQDDLPACARYPANAASYSCSCGPAGSPGGIWGSGPYTGDSDLCTAARHAGVLGPEGGPIMAVRSEGLASYAGSDQNGIRSQDWGRYPLSLSFAPPVETAVAPEPPSVPPALPELFDLPGDVATDAPGENPFADATDPGPIGVCAGIGPDVETRCYCEPNGYNGTVWGAGPYTADSDLCTAARHAGAIGLAGGEISVIRLPGLTGYKATERNGILTSEWGEYGESFIVNANN